MTDLEVTTYVEDRAECYSACALFFLPVGEMNEVAKRTPQHIWHVGGRLGLHAPYLRKRRKTKPFPAEVANVYKAAISGVTDAIQLSENRTFGDRDYTVTNRPWVSSSLLLKRSNGRGQNISYRHRGKAGCWGIGLVGEREIDVSVPKALPQQTRQRICVENRWKRGRPDGLCSSSIVRR